MYILLTKENAVSEIIPDYDPVFPGVPVPARYAPDFVANLMRVEDDTEVRQNWVYDPDSQTFSEPPELEIPVNPPEPTDPTEPSDTDVLNALLGVTAE